MVELCRICKGEFSEERREILHAFNCPNRPSVLNQSAKITSLAAARFEKDSDPKNHSANAALDAAQDWINAQEEKPDHVIVMIGRNLSDGSSGTKFLQAGSYNYHAQIGLVIEGMNLLRESG